MKRNPQPKVSASIAFVASMIFAVILLVGCGAVGPEAESPTCDGSLQGLVNAAAPGDVVEAAGGCIYERDGHHRQGPLTLRAASGSSEVRGSEIWDDAVWSQQGSTWISSKAVPPLATDDGWQCEPDSRRCRWPEQVFVAGGQLTQVDVGTTPDRGTVRARRKPQGDPRREPLRQDRRSDRTRPLDHRGSCRYRAPRASR